MSVTLEVFGRWADDTTAWSGYGIGTCPLCLRAHRLEQPVNGQTVSGLCPRSRSEQLRVQLRSEPMQTLRRPLRAGDDPTDPQTPWVRYRRLGDEPPY